MTEQNYLEVAKVSVPGFDRKASYELFVKYMHNGSGQLRIEDLFTEARTRFGKIPYHVIDSNEALLKSSSLGRTQEPSCELFPIRGGLVRLAEKVEGLYVVRYKTLEEQDFAGNIPNMSKDQTFGTSFVLPGEVPSSPIVAMSNLVHAEHASRIRPLRVSPNMTRQQILELLDTSDGNCELEERR